MHVNNNLARGVTCYVSIYLLSRPITFETILVLSDFQSAFCVFRFDAMLDIPINFCLHNGAEADPPLAGLPDVGIFTI